MGLITDLCERLADAYELQGVSVRENLKPGVSREAVLKALAPLKLPVPEDVLELYAWRNGHILEFDPDMHRNLCFRDDTFISIEDVVEQYLMIQRSYSIHSSLETDRVDLKTVIPISSFEGAWDVVVCGEHRYDAGLINPVVHIHQDISLYYHSVESMLRTCIDWVSSQHWEHLDFVPHDIEMAIWRRHNPGIFEH
jgi:hypothetical protein